MRLGSEDGPITTSMEVSGFRSDKEAKDGVATVVLALSVIAKE